MGLAPAPGRSPRLAVMIACNSGFWDAVEPLLGAGLPAVLAVNAIGSTLPMPRDLDGMNFGEIMSELSQRRVLIRGRSIPGPRGATWPRRSSRSRGCPGARPAHALPSAMAPHSIEQPGHDGPARALRAAALRALALTDEALLATCDQEFFVGGGPGGQHRNKTESGVRLAHAATGVVVTATERRSQAQNRAAALARLRVRLAALARERRPRRPTAPTRGSQQRRLAAKRHAARRKAERRERD